MYRRPLKHAARAAAAAALALATLGTPAAMATSATMTVTASPSPVTTGAPVVYTMTVSPPPNSATVSLQEDGQLIAGCGARPVTNGTATCATTASSVAALHTLYAILSGGGFVDAHAYVPVIGATATTVTASPKLVDPGEAMTYIATVTPRPVSISPGGFCQFACTVETVGFSVDGTPVADCLERPVNLGTGIATCQTAVAPAAGGKHIVTASYVGNEYTYLTPSSGTDDFAVRAPAVSLSTSALSFGSVTVGASGTQTVTVTNTGNRTLHLADATAGGAFTIVSNTCAGASLDPGATCVITLAFAPTYAGHAAATLAIASDAGPATAALTGDGAAVPTAPTGTAPTGTAPTGAALPPNSKTTFTATVSDSGGPSTVTVPLRCPVGVACTLDGTVVISTSELATTRALRAVDTKTVARFSGVHVAPGKVRAITLTLSPAFIRTAQARGIRFIHATLTVNTTFTDGSKATRGQQVIIRIPKAAPKKKAKKAVVKRVPHFTG